MASEVLAIVFSVLAAFVLGGVGVLFLGGRTALNYLIVKASRGKKVLLFAKTKFGWRTFTAAKDENLLRWTFDKKHKITVIEDDEVTRYLRIDLCFVDADKPLRALKVAGVGGFPEDFDPETFNNLLIRAMTRPTTDGFDEIKKMLQIILVLIVVIGLGLLFLYYKVNALSGGAATGGVI